MASRAAASLTAGVTAGILTVLFELSYASLIFNGELASFVSRGVSMMLLGTAISLLVSAVFGLLRGSAVAPQDTPVAIMATMASGIVAGTPGPLIADRAFPTLVVAMLVTTLGAGTVFFAVARLRLARFIRIIPYPVVGGFLAGVGWLMVRGAVSTMLGFTPRLSQIVLMFSGDFMLRWVPGLAFGLALLLVSRRIRNALLVPTAVVLGTVLFYLTLLITDTSLATATAEGWVLGGLQHQQPWIPLGSGVLRSADWSLISQQWSAMLSAIVVSVLAAVLNLSAVETLSNRSSDTRRELTAVAVANFGGGLAGSPIAYHSVSYTGLVTLMTGSAQPVSRASPRRTFDWSSRLPAFAGAAVCMVAFFFGVSLFSVFPKAVLGGLLVFVGGGFLLDWLYDGARRLPRRDYAIGLGMLIVVVFAGLLWAVALGLLASVVIFAVTYGRAEVVYQYGSGVELGSNVERSLQQREVLRRQGRHIAVFRLRGFIFFGTAYSIFEAIRRRVEDAADLRPRFLVLDMCHVRGLDGSGELVFQRIARFAADRRIFLLLSSVDAQLREQLRRRGVVDGENPYLRTFGDLDHALEWAEDRILVSHGFPVRRRRRRIDEVLTGLLGDALQAERLFPYLKRHEVREGHKLVGEGEEVSGVYIVTLGEFAVFLEDAGRPPRRLRSMREGSVFGAAEAFLRVPLASTLVATSSSECYSIPVELVQSIGAAEPDLAPVLQDLIVRVLAERVIDTNRTVRVLSE